ncbi:hypothetical protein EDB86DRAFT_3137772 [Lactarius hatsudake]|nr:hypothetical protein EDB86DRAFT_3137772 [Lactarius hatsudake]
MATANPLHATIAAKGLSPMRLPYAAANAGPAATSGFSDGQPKPKVRHFCKNMQKAAQGSASYLLAFIGIGGPRWLSLCLIPIPDGGVRCIQITASPASHDFTPLPAVKLFPPIPGVSRGPPQWPVLARSLPRVRLGGRIVAFVLGVKLASFGPVPIGASSLLWDKTAGCWLRFIGCGSTLRFCGYPPTTHWSVSLQQIPSRNNRCPRYRLKACSPQYPSQLGPSLVLGIRQHRVIYQRTENASTSMMRLLYTALSQWNHVIPTGIAFRLKQFTTWYEDFAGVSHYLAHSQVSPPTADCST